MTRGTGEVYGLHVHRIGCGRMCSMYIGEVWVGGYPGVEWVGGSMGVRHIQV